MIFDSISISITFLPDQTVFSSDDFSLLRHSRQQPQQPQQPQQHPREYLTMNVGGGPGDREHHQPQAGGLGAGGSGFQAASHINSIQRQQPHQQPQRRSSIEATTNPSSKADSSGLIPQPPPPPSIHDMASASAEAAGGCRLGLGHTGQGGQQRGVPNTMAIQAGGGRHPLVDFCTLRRPASNNRPPPRSVQFADQQNVSNSTDLLMLL